ncbi:MAG: tetratricopeptide repeat protein [Acidobacteriota bacterium]
MPIKSLAIIVVLLCLFGVAVGQAPRTAEDYNNRGLERQTTGDMEGAIQDYTRALSIKDSSI